MYLGQKKKKIKESILSKWNFSSCYLIDQYKISSQKYLWIRTAVFHPSNTQRKEQFFYTSQIIYGEQHVEFQNCRRVCRFWGLWNTHLQWFQHWNMLPFPTSCYLFHFTFWSLDQLLGNWIPSGSRFFFIFHLLGDNRPITEVKCPNSRKWVFWAKTIKGKIKYSNQLSTS